MAAEEFANAALDGDRILLTIPKLTKSNYKDWENDAMSILFGRDVWDYVTPEFAYPPADAAGKAVWTRGARLCVHLLWQSLSQEIRDNATILSCMREVRPFDMWRAIRDEAQQINSGARYNVVEDQMKIRKREDELLDALYHRIIKLSQTRKALRPSGYTLANFDDEFDVFSFIRALPDEYDSFAQTL
ncbi:hypothetical protein EXIGLDRAFT_615696, partial [Exidia glandulosa HHB12029]